MRESIPPQTRARRPRCHTPMCRIAPQAPQWRTPAGRSAKRDGRPGRFVLRMQIPISRNEGTMAGTKQRADMTYVVNRRGKHVHHGRTLAAWTGSVIGLLAFIIGGMALVIPDLAVFVAPGGLAAVALIVTVVLQRLGYGAH